MSKLVKKRLTSLFILKGTIQYYIPKTENVDWESCQTVYPDILYLFVTQYLSPEEILLIASTHERSR